MKKINLKGISEILSEKELKNVIGGGSCGISYSCEGYSCDTIMGVRGQCVRGPSGCTCGYVY